MAVRPSWVAGLTALSSAAVGGQAVIEGVMMRSPRAFVVAVRKPDGRIAVREDPWTSIWTRFSFLRWPFLRGGVVLVEALRNGFAALKWSAEQATEAQAAGEHGTEEKPIEEKVGDGSGGEAPISQGSDWALNGTLALSLLAAFALFIGVPHGVGLLLGKVFRIGWMDGQSVGFHLVAGILKVAVFLAYILLISRMAEIRRVFEYHGAEHKSIFTYEHGEDLTVANARKHSRLHPRCGTSFLFIVIITSILVFSIAFAFVPPLLDNRIANQLLIVGLKLPLLFPIAGLAYEFQRFTARHCQQSLVKPLLWPGLMLQTLTTREPDDAQLEIGLASLKKTLWLEQQCAVSECPPSTCRVYTSFIEIEPLAAAG